MREPFGVSAAGHGLTWSGCHGDNDERTTRGGTPLERRLAEEAS
jgi:hypothetical protein